jgi:hypothetical protein
MNTDKRFPATSDPGQLKTQDITATQPSHVKTKKTKKSDSTSDQQRSEKLLKRYPIRAFGNEDL